MLEVVFAGVGRALTSLGGPVGRYAIRKTADPRRVALAEELEQVSDASRERTAVLVRALLDAGLTQANLIEVARFANSDEGEYATRLIAIHALAGRPLKEQTTELLVAQTAALIRLHARQPVHAYADDAARILVVEISAAVHRAYRRLEARHPEMAYQVRDVVAAQSRLPELFSAESLRGRTESLVALSSLIPSDVETQIRKYSEIVQTDTADIALTAVGRTAQIAIDDCLITPDVSTSAAGLLYTRNGLENVSLLADALTSRPRILVLGDPGGGKSTAVQAAVHEYTKATAQEVGRTVPFVVVLRHFARALVVDPLLGFVAYLTRTHEEEHDQAVSVETLRYLLHMGRAVVFFDGLDEILDIEMRRVVARKINRFANRFPASPMVVTSRVVGYSEAPVSQQFAALEIEPFSDPKVEAFALNVFNALAQDSLDVSALHGRFMRESSSVKDLRSNPLMLGILCFMFAIGRTMPNNRLELYRKCAELLFESWDEHRGVSLQLQDPAAAEQAVREVALAIFLSGQEEASESAVKEKISQFYLSTSASLPPFRARAFAEEVFSAWTGRKWILAFAGEQDGEIYYRFAHRTFLEYFAADQIAYDCESAVDAWAHVKPYVLSVTATPLCQLVVQIVASRTRGAWDKIVQAALDESTGAALREKVLVTAFLVNVLPSVRSEVQTRNQLLRTALGLLAELQASGAEPQVQDQSRSESLDTTSDQSRNRTQQTARSQSDEDPELLDLGGALVFREAPNLLSGFAHLPIEERERLIGVVRDYFVELEATAGRQRDAARCALVLKELKTPSSAGGEPTARWFEQLSTAAVDLWDDYMSRPMSAGDLQGDYWLSVAVLKDEGATHPELLMVIGVDGLLAPGWTVSGPQLERSGCVALTLFLALIGLRRHGTAQRWTGDDLERLADAVVELPRPERLASRQPSMAEHAPTFEIELRKDASADWRALSDARRNAAVMLGEFLVGGGYLPFLEDLNRKNVLSRDLWEAIRRASDSLRASRE